MRIGVDIMGGDNFPESPVEGAIRALASLGEQVELVLIGDQSVIISELERQGASPEAFSIVHTPEYITMSDSPTRAVAAKRNSSINLGIGMVKAGTLDGFISPGNTGAMLVASVMGLGNVPGVERPTIGVLVRNMKGGYSLLCDVGANVDCRADHLVQFALLCNIYMKEVVGIENPTVALLNIGEEPSKGNQAAISAHGKLKERTDLNFIGNLEGRDFLPGHADIFICDGFTGNIVLKFGESFYDVLASQFSGSQVAENFNFENYGGVPILGVNGISVIGHGISNGKAIENMIKTAYDAAKNHLPTKIKAAFANFSA
ncbi:MAG: phosphate acyltransferase PlsX [Bacteroidia bacterium]|nr:phosphate acyltransferase PlsX [Bacteroidia bacterium]